MISVCGKYFCGPWLLDTATLSKYSLTAHIKKKVIIGSVVGKVQNKILYPYGNVTLYSAVHDIQIQIKLATTLLIFFAIIAQEFKLCNRKDYK